MRSLQPKTHMRLAGFLTACFLLLFSGCQGPFSPQDRAGTGTLSLTINSPVGRTILPNWPSLDSFYGFRIDFFAEDKDIDTPYFYRTWDGFSQIYDSKTGTWNLTITALLYFPGENVVPVAWGVYKDLQVFSGQIAEAVITLYPIVVD